MAKTIKDLESQMCRPLYCDICRVHMSGPAPAEQHYSSRNHARKAEVLLRIKLSETLGGPSGEHFCKECRVACKSKTDLTDHFQSAEHRDMCQRDENPIGIGFGATGRNSFFEAIHNGAACKQNTSSKLQQEDRVSASPGNKGAQASGNAICLPHRDDAGEERSLPLPITESRISPLVSSLSNDASQVASDRNQTIDANGLHNQQSSQVFNEGKPINHRSASSTIQSPEVVNGGLTNNIVDDGIVKPQALCTGNQRRLVRDIGSPIDSTACGLTKGTAVNGVQDVINNTAAAEQQDDDREYELSPLGRGICFICKVLLTSHPLAEEHLNGRKHKNARGAWLVSKHCAIRATKEHTDSRNALRERGTDNEHSDGHKANLGKVTENFNFPDKTCENANKTGQDEVNKRLARDAPLAAKPLQNRETTSFLYQVESDASFQISLRSFDNCNTSNDSMKGLHALPLLDSLRRNPLPNTTDNRVRNVEESVRKSSEVKELNECKNQRSNSDLVLKDKINKHHGSSSTDSGSENVNLHVNAIDKSIQCPSLNILTAKSVAVGSERGVNKVRTNDTSSNIDLANNSSKAWNEGRLCGININLMQTSGPEQSAQRFDDPFNGSNTTKFGPAAECGLYGTSLCQDESFSQKITRPSLRNEIDNFSGGRVPEGGHTKTQMSASDSGGALGLLDLPSALGQSSIQKSDEICSNVSEYSSRNSSNGVDSKTFEAIIRKINNYTLEEVCGNLGESVSGDLKINPYNSPSDLEFSRHLPNNCANGMSSVTDKALSDESKVLIAIRNGQGRTLWSVENGQVTPIPSSCSVPVDQASADNIASNAQTVSFNRTVRNHPTMSDNLPGSEFSNFTMSSNTDKTIWHPCSICLKKLNSAKQLEIHMITTHNIHGMTDMNLTSPELATSEANDITKTPSQQLSLAGLLGTGNSINPISVVTNTGSSMYTVQAGAGNEVYGPTVFSAGKPKPSSITSSADKYPSVSATEIIPNTAAVTASGVSIKAINNAKSASCGTVVEASGNENAEAKVASLPALEPNSVLGNQEAPISAISNYNNNNNQSTLRRLVGRADP